VACVGALLSSTVLSSAYAEEQKTVSSLDTVTVVATKTARSTFDVPGMVTVVDADDPSVAGASNIKELLQDMPGVEFNGSARRNGQNITMRGFDTEGIVILFDGVRQKFEAAHDGKFFLDPNLIQRVEVIKGPNSTLYGSGGLGGVIAFETKDASDLLAPGETRGATTTAGFQSVNDEWMLSQSGYARSETFDILGSVMTRNSDDIELGDGSTLASEDEVLSGLFKLGWSPIDNHTFRLNVQGYNNDALEPNNPQSATDTAMVNKDTASYTTSVAYEYEDPDNRLLNLKTKVYYTDTEVDEQEVSTARDLSRQLDTIGFTVENQSRFGEGSNFANTLTYGGEFYTEEQNGSDSTGTSREAGGIPDAESEFWGIFLQDEIAWKPNAVPGEFLIIPGIRLDSYESNNTTGLDLDESEVSPKLGVTYKPNDWLMLFGNYAHAFRAPTMTEIFTTGTHFTIPGSGSNVFVPNPNLKPETSKTLEFGFGMQFDDVWQKEDHLQFKVSRFDIKSDDFIDTEVNVTFFPTCCGTTQSVNVPNASLHGVEFEGGYENKRIKLGLGYSQITGKNDDTGEYLSNITPPTITTNVGLKLPEVDSIIGWKTTFADEHDKVNDASAARDGYGVHDLYYQWQPEQHDNVVVNLGVDNVFDKNYSRVFANSPEPGRNYRIQVSYKW
jgi:hemoglobin/transferrin/lactoferrin receptor protein